MENAQSLCRFTLIQMKNLSGIAMMCVNNNIGYHHGAYKTNSDKLAYSYKSWTICTNGKSLILSPSQYCRKDNMAKNIMNMCKYYYDKHRK